MSARICADCGDPLADHSGMLGYRPAPCRAVHDGEQCDCPAFRLSDRPAKGHTMAEPPDGRLPRNRARP